MKKHTTMCKIKSDIFISGLLFVMFLLMPFGSLHAQTEAELDAAILEFKRCFEKLSMPEVHNSTYELSTGKRIRVLAQSDFERSAFSTVDAMLENIDKLKDSFFFSANRKLLMDGKDLSKWEVESIRDISNEYFKTGEYAFHLAAHGLVNPDGTSSEGVKIDGQELNADETAELLLLSMEKNYHHVLNSMYKPFTVVLHCCNSAKGTNSFAARLSAALSKHLDNVAVVAAPDIVYCTQDANGKYTERVTSENAIKNGSYDKEKKDWIVFKNGAKLMTGTTDYGTTVEKYLSEK